MSRQSPPFPTAGARKTSGRSMPISASISSKSSNRCPIVSTMATRPSAMALSRRTSNRRCRQRCTTPSKRSEPEHGLALIERQNYQDRTYRVSYGELTAPMVKAIQQQQQEIEAVRQQNADLRRALEHQIAALKAQNAALRHSIRSQREQVTAAR